MNPRPLTVEKHGRLRLALIQAERMAALTLTTIRGRTASEVAAEVAACAIAALRSKASNPSRP
jgi:hypothetical protein